MATTRRVPATSRRRSGIPRGPDSAASRDPEATVVESLRRQVIALQRISSLGVLAGGVFHELNNALTPILNYAKLGLRNPDPAYRERALTQIVDAAQRAATITRGMLGLSRPGNLTHREPTDMARLVDEVTMLVKKDMARHRVRLDVKANGKLVCAGQSGTDSAGAVESARSTRGRRCRVEAWCGSGWGWTRLDGGRRSA